MVNWSKYTELILIIAFGIVLLLRPGFYDYDSYYFLGIACGTIQPGTNDALIVGQLLSYLPCSEWFIKLVLIGLFTIGVFLIQQICGLINPRYQQYGVILFGSVLTFYGGFARLEDDTFGIPFILLSLYFLISYWKKNQPLDYYIGLLFIGIGALFWPGIIVWGAIYLASNPYLWTISIGILYYFQEKLFMQNGSIAENIPFFGIAASALLFLGTVSVPMIFLPGFVLAILLAGFKLKYAMYLGLFLGIGAYDYFAQKEFFEYKTTIGMAKSLLLLLFLLSVNVTSIVGLYSAPPTNETIELVRYAVQDNNGTMIQNDWELGHLIRSMGGKASNAFGPPPPDFKGYHGYAIAHEKLECRILRGSPDYNYYHC